MTTALWKKAFLESRLMLLGCLAGTFVFMSFFVWLSSQISLDAVQGILYFLPEPIRKMIGVPVEVVATRRGQLAMSYVDPVLLAIAGLWAIARGTDSVSGEIGRGTLELTLAQPIRRTTLLWTHNAITIAGAALIALAAWLGTTVGIALVETGQHRDAVASAFLPAAVNLFAMIFFLAALSAFVSSWDRYRWRSIGIMAAIYIVAMVLEMLSRTVPRMEWAFWLTFLGPYEPHVLAAVDGADEQFGLAYNALLIGPGVLCYAAATWIFARRDIPAPI